MSANSYNAIDLLIGKTYRSATLNGEIIGAEEHPQAIWYQDAKAYRVLVRKASGGYTYRSVAVSV